MQSTGTCLLCRGVEQTLQVAAANVLMVGAGGIGCELIKTLVLTGFRKVTMVRLLCLSYSSVARRAVYCRLPASKRVSFELCTILPSLDLCAISNTAPT